MKKVVEIYSIIYLAALVLLMLAVLLCGILKVQGAIFIILAFVVVLIVGYIIGALLRMSYLRYECPKCHEIRKINFFEYIFAGRMDGARKLKCKNCGTKEYMEEVQEEDK